LRFEADLIDHLFDSTEKRLARTLPARSVRRRRPARGSNSGDLSDGAGGNDRPRSRVNFFMNKFRKLGFIEHKGEIKINGSPTAAPHE
jgi:CRP/FNR family cyclic AMP-dependent transcriptional regulator